jgi:hypothetical protein
MAQFKKGQSGNPAGRPPGAINMLSRTTKVNVQQCFEDMGGLPAFVEWAKKNQTRFYQLYVKLLPHEVSGEDGAGVTVIIQKFSEQDGG